MTDTIAEPKKMGRPSSYTDATGHAVAMLYSAGVPWKKLCAREGMPSWDTIRRWRLDRDDFPLLLARAKSVKAEWHAEQGLGVLADLEDSDLVELGRAASAAVGRRGKLSDYHRWLASTLDRDTYGANPAMEAAAALMVSAFSDMRPIIQGEAAVIAPSLPHVTTPDGSHVEAPDT